MDISVSSAVENSTISLKRGIFRSVTEDGLLVVDIQPPSKKLLKCHWLENGDSQPLRLVEGDEVLVAISAEPRQRPCVLGRVSRYASSPGQEEKLDRNQQELVLKADQQIVLTCGESTITLRQDGKVLITGVDVVSRAARTQRIKGGSVQIN